MQHNHRALWSQSASRLWQLERFQILACVYMQYGTYSHVLSLTSLFHFESIKLWLRVCFYPVAQFPTNNHLSLITFHLAPGFFFLFVLDKWQRRKTAQRFFWWNFKAFLLLAWTTALWLSYTTNSCWFSFSYKYSALQKAHRESLMWKHAYTEIKNAKGLKYRMWLLYLSFLVQSNVT